MSQASRITYSQLAPKAFSDLPNLSNGLRHDSSGARLVDLVLLCMSQINGCVLCIDMHQADLIKVDEDPRHLSAVTGWRETPFFIERERGVALRWAELVTNTLHSDTSDGEFTQLRECFSDEEIAELNFAAITISSWNLLSVSPRNPVPLKAPHVAAA